MDNISRDMEILKKNHIKVQGVAKAKTGKLEERLIESSQIQMQEKKWWINKPKQKNQNSQEL
jgi:hypothetical protein